MKNTIGFFHRLAYAISTGLVGMLLVTLPHDVAVLNLIGRLLDLPVAAVGLLLPASWQGIDLWFTHQEYGYLHFSELLLLHLRVAIPIYLFLFYLPLLFRSGASWWRGRRTNRTLGAAAAAK